MAKYNGLLFDPKEYVPNDIYRRIIITYRIIMILLYIKQ